MYRVPKFSNLSLHAKAGIGVGPLSDRIKARYGVEASSQFVGAGGGIVDDHAEVSGCSHAVTGRFWLT